MMDYLMKILNESDKDDNINTDEDPRFPECDADLSNKNLEQNNHSSYSEMYTTDEINENNTDGNFYTGISKVTKFKKR